MGPEFNALKNMSTKKDTCCGFPLQSTVKILTIFEIVRNTCAIILNVSFVSLRIYCMLRNTGDNILCQFLDYIFPRLNIQYSGVLAAFFLIFSTMQLYLAVLCYHASKEQSLQKCQTAFISLLVIWILGLSISIYVVDRSPPLIWAVIVIYSLRFLYLTVFKKYLNVLRKVSIPTPVPV